MSKVRREPPKWEVSIDGYTSLASTLYEAIKHVRRGFNEDKLAIGTKIIIERVQDPREDTPVSPRR